MDGVATCMVDDSESRHGTELENMNRRVGAGRLSQTAF